MIYQCKDKEVKKICEVINDSAQAYKGVIPVDCYREPYISEEELRQEIDEGIVFWGYKEGGKLIAVMGIKHVQDTTLIRHTYVRASKRNQGIGGKLLAHLREQTNLPILICVWADAVWAIRFYEKHGFRLVSSEEKNQLLRRYSKILKCQIESSVVLTNRR